MTQIHREIFATLTLAILLTGTATTAQDDCRDILMGGTFKTTLLKESSYNRLVLAAQLATVDKGTAEESLGISGEGFIEGIPIGAKYSESQYNEWSKAVRKSINVDQINSHALSILSHEGDSTIVEAWKACMLNAYSNKAPLHLHIENEGGASEVLWLVLSYDINPGIGRDIEITDLPHISGAKIQSGQETLGRGAIIKPGSKRRLPLERADASKPVVVRISTSIGEDRTAYFPPVIELPKIVQSRQVEYQLRGGPNIPEEPNKWSSTRIELGSSFVVFEKDNDVPNTNKWLYQIRVSADGQVKPQSISHADSAPRNGGSILSSKDGESEAPSGGITLKVRIIDNYFLP